METHQKHRQPYSFDYYALLNSNIKTFVLTEPTPTQAQALPSEEKASTLSVELEAQKMLVDYLGTLFNI